MAIASNPPAQLLSIPVLESPRDPVTVPVPVFPPVPIPVTIPINTINTTAYSIVDTDVQPSSLTSDYVPTANDTVRPHASSSTNRIGHVISSIKTDDLIAWSRKLSYLIDDRAQTHGVKSIYHSFASCTELPEYLEVASKFITRFDLTAAEAAAAEAISDGQGLDRAAMEEHMAEIQQHGFSAFLSSRSAELAKSTLQPKSDDADRHSGKYILPIPEEPAKDSGTYQHVDLAGRALDQLHELLAKPHIQITNIEGHGMPHPRDIIADIDSQPQSNQHKNGPPMESDISAFATGTVISYTAMSPDAPKIVFEPLQRSSLVTDNMFETIQQLARNGGPIILPPTMKINHGLNMRSFPYELAPPKPLEVHFAKDVRKKHGFILPAEFARQACADAHLPLHASLAQIAAKAGNHPLGRQVSNYSHPKGRNTNNRLKKILLAWIFGPIESPATADLCQLLINAGFTFGVSMIVACRLDIRAAFTRIRITPEHVPLCALYFEVDGEKFYFFPLSCRFGSQDSNYQWQCVAIETINQSNDRQIALFQRSHSTVITDDFVVFGTPESTTQEMEAIKVDAIARMGPEPISDEKTLQGPQIEIKGIFFDCPARTISISESMFSKMLCVFMLQLPWEIPVDFQVDIEFLQRMQSYAISGADIMLALKSFSRGFSANLREHPSSSTGRVALTRRSISDIWMWRIVLTLTIHDVRWITIPIEIPILFRRLPTETLAMFALRQAQKAQYVIYGDACTTNHGLGTYMEHIGYSLYEFTELTEYIDVDGTYQPIDINVLEFIAAILSLVLLIRELTRKGVSLRGCHVHIWSDNTSCLSWMRKHRADHPLHLFLLHMFSFIQVRFGVIVTTGHIPGVINIYADAASRAFQCQNGNLIRDQLSHQLPLLPVPTSFMRDIVKAAKQQSDEVWKSALDALMALDKGTG